MFSRALTFLAPFLWTLSGLFICIDLQGHMYVYIACTILINVEEGGFFVALFKIQFMKPSNLGPRTAEILIRLC